MAIKPEQAKKLTKEEQELVGVLETSIDRVLQSGKRVFSAFPKEITEKVLESLKQLYCDAGWVVDWSNERDGVCMKFYEKEAIKKRSR